MRSLLEVLRQAPSRISAAGKDPSTYDMIVIGTPVWAWSVSSLIRAYLFANKGRLPAMAFFCTFVRAGNDRTFAQVQELASKRPVACLSIRARAVASAIYEKRVATFVEALQQGPAKQRERAAPSAG